MIVHRIRTPRTARLIQHDVLDENTRFVWIACHGYGMPVTRFSESFGVLPKGHVALCPEGLSRFYWGGFSGTPVASWMTKEERLEEIADFCEWLDQVFAFAKTHCPDAKIIAFGFSQGAATIMRWLNATRPEVCAIVLWSGTPPEDISYKPKDYFKRIPMFARWGNSDELVSWDKAKNRFDEVDLPVDIQLFQGDHKIYEDPLLELVSSIEKTQLG